MKIAVILCGGRGLRLRPITNKIPKPMVLIKYNKPFIFFLIKQLHKAKFNKIYLLTGYKSKKIEHYIKKEEEFKKINIIIKKTPVNFDTVKRIRSILKFISSPFLLCYSDNLVNFNIKKYYKKFHNRNYVVIKESISSLELGNVNIKKQKIYDYSETRSKGHKYVELGYFILQKNVLDLIKKNSNNVSFSSIINQLSRDKKLFFYKTSSEYLSITNLQKLRRTRIKINKFKI